MKAGRWNSFRVGLTLALIVVTLTASTLVLRSVHADSLPQVQINADGIAPRPIEELTGRNVTRDYANAWRDLSEALTNNKPDLLNAYFTGFAKDNFSKLISDQKKTGVRAVSYTHLTLPTICSV